MSKTYSATTQKHIAESTIPVKQNITETIITQSADSVIAIAQSKAFKAKEKVFQISNLLLNNNVSIDQVIQTAATQIDVVKGTLIEAMVFASNQTPELINKKAFEFVIASLKADAPRVKWEAAKVIANTAHLFLKLLKKAVTNLLSNTEHPGTVVRWSAATSLSRIISLNTPLNKDLIPAVEAIQKWEEDNAVRKIYEKVLKSKKR